MRVPRGKDQRGRKQCLPVRADRMCHVQVWMQLRSRAEKGSLRASFLVDAYLFKGYNYFICVREEEDRMNKEEASVDSIQKEKDRGQNAYYSSRPKLGGSGPSKLRQQFSRGMTYFLVVAASILFYFALLRVTNLSEGFSKIFQVLKPVVYGCVIAYLLNPIVKKADKYLAPVLEKKVKTPGRAKKTARGIGILLSLILLLVLVVTLCNMLIPELYSSIRNLVFTLPGQLNDLVDKLNTIKIDDSTTGTLIKAAIEEGIVIGGGAALVNIYKELKKELTDENPDISRGMRVVLDSLSSPLYQIAENAGFNGNDIVDKQLSQEGNFGFDAKDGKFVDMFESGIVDPCKVTRSAILNAASISGLLITTEAAVGTNKEKNPAPAMPDMGGMY